MKSRMRKFGMGAKDSSGSYASGVRLGNAKGAKWLHRAAGGRCEMGEVEGDKAKMRFDRPGRKHGGSVKKKADGGWIGEGDSGKKLREGATETRKEANKGSLLSAGAMGSGLGMVAGGGPKAKLIGSGLAALGVPSAVRMFKGNAKADTMEKEADKAEGRKSGGRTKAKSKDTG